MRDTVHVPIEALYECAILVYVFAGCSMDRQGAEGYE